MVSLEMAREDISDRLNRIEEALYNFMALFKASQQNAMTTSIHVEEIIFQIDNLCRYMEVHFRANNTDVMTIVQML